MSPTIQGSGQRWERRPLLAALLRLAVFVVPVAAAVVSAAVAARLIPRPVQGLTVVAWWAAIFGISTGVLLVLDRLARRFLPLASLLNLSLLFPARAPRRLAVARRVGTVRQLQERLVEARAAGVHDDAAQAAETILTLVAALQMHDRRTRGHAERVRMYTDMLAVELNLPEADRDRLRWAALLHDIGKLAISADLLNKPARLNDSEWHEMRHHPEAGAVYCGPLLEWLGPWGDTIQQHHERWDGKGYPQGLAGEEICAGARIVAVPDAYEVMTATRSYKPAMTASAARNELARCAGTQFDPAIVRAFLNLSIPRLQWVMGPTAWIAQLPFVQHKPRLTSVTSTAAGIALLGLSTMSGGPAVPPAQPDSLPATPAAPVAGEAAPPGVVSEGAGDPELRHGRLQAWTPLGLLAYEPAPEPTGQSPLPAADHSRGTDAVLSDTGVVELERSPRHDGVDPRFVPPPPPRADAGDNAPPVAVADAATINEGESVTVAVLANDHDPDGSLDPSTLKLVRGIGHGLGSLRVDAVGGRITFADGRARKPVTTFAYEICDDDGACASAPVAVTVLRPSPPRGRPDRGDAEHPSDHRPSRRPRPAPTQTDDEAPAASGEDTDAAPADEPAQPEADGEPAAEQSEAPPAEPPGNGNGQGNGQGNGNGNGNGNNQGNGQGNDKDKDKDKDKGGNDVGLLPDLDLPSAEGLLTWFADFLRFLPFV